ncbi:MAG: hypothetical protein IJB96_09580 [Lachnospira sp.]|nr:hypothetical protein [Lachnospira sp.]
MFFVIMMQLCACGNIERELVSTAFNESKQYYEAPSETKLYKYSDFDRVVLGETTIMELYETVGESQGCLLLNLHMDYIYPLENGKYLSVECWYYDMENGDTDYTVDKMILLDTNPLQS